MLDLLKLWPVFTSIVVSVLTVGVLKTKQGDLVKDVNRLKEECEESKICISNINLEVNYLKNRDKDFIRALERNTDVCQELKIAIAVINEKNHL